MFRKHIDFLAIFFLAVVMAAFSKASSVRLPDLDAIRMQNAVNSQSCPLSQAFAHIENILNR
jgi:hypothetical protein